MAEGASRLAWLVAPTPLPTFLDHHLGRCFFHQPGAADRFLPLLAWADLNRILEDHRLAPPRLRLARDGATLAEDVYARPYTSRRGAYTVLEPTRLRAELKAGATLIVDAVDQLHAPVRELAASLERELSEGVQANLYASWRERQGFGLHWDDHDVLVLQLAGRKRWRVHGMTRPHPLYRDVAEPAPPAGEPVWDGVLEAGAMIHVPRGHWHDAMASGEPSLHLTIGLSRPTGVDLVSWLADRLRAEELFRRDLPRRTTREERRHHARALRDAVLGRMTDDVLDELFDWQDEHARARPRLSLPWGIVDESLQDEARLRSAVPRPTTLYSHPNGVELRALGRSWVFAETAAPMLAQALDGEVHQVGELLSAGPPEARDQRRDLLAYLCQNDVLAPQS